MAGNHILKRGCKKFDVVHITMLFTIINHEIIFIMCLEGSKYHSTSKQLPIHGQDSLKIIKLECKIFIYTTRICEVNIKVKHAYGAAGRRGGGSGVKREGPCNYRKIIFPLKI